MVQQSCNHNWKRQKGFEESLKTVVLVRTCSLCGRLEAKAGHRDPGESEGWIFVAESLPAIS
jgi:hypothetical protein